MVGAIKSNRCGTCKQRKVKCDLTWPVCGPCKRGNRMCPPRPSLKIIDEGQQVKQVAKSLPSKAVKFQRQDQYMHGCVARHKTLLNKHMTLSPSERLSYTLISSLSMESLSCSLKTLGAFMWRIPQRIGSSIALDAVTSCLLASHDAVLRGGNRPSRINPHLYAQALCHIQRAIQDPKERLSYNTLCAVLLFQRIEAVFGECLAPFNQKYLQGGRKNGELIHASGLATLIQETGPPKPGEMSDTSVIIDSHACIIHQALVQGKVCFLASEEWQQLDDMENRTEVQAIFYRVLRQMTHWPTLLCEKRAILCNDGRTTSLTVFLKGAREVKKAMDDLGQELDTLIKAHRLCQYIQSTCLFDMVSEMYKMDDTTVGMVLCYHAMYSIVVLRVIWSLADPFDQLILEAEILHLCKRVWMLIEHGRQCMPLGLPILQSALMMTIESVNWETQDRIIEIMNELERFRERGRNTWTREGLINKAMFYRGDWVTHVG